MVARGNIVLVPVGTPVEFGEDDAVHVTRREHVAVVDYTYDDGKLAYMVGENERRVAADAVTVLDTGDHRLTVGRRRVVGGSPIRGGGNIYSTPGRCACGVEFKRMSNAREVRSAHRDHVIARQWAARA